MKKYYLCIVFIFVAFSATVIAQETEGSAPAEAPAPKAAAESTTKTKIASFLVGSGMDLRYYIDRNKLDSTAESSLKADPALSNIFFQWMNSYFSAGVRLFGFLDIYGRAGFGWNLVAGTVVSNDSSFSIFANIFDVNLDANVRASIMFIDTMGLYAHFNGGIAIRVFKGFISQANTKDEMIAGYISGGAGFLYKMGKNSIFSMGYNLHYSLSPLFVDASVIAYTGPTLPFIGANILSHGMNFEYQYLF